MSYDLESLTPKPSNWFSTVVEYEGWGRAEFASPRGTVEGFTKIVFDEFGNSSIEMNIERFHSEQIMKLGLEQFFSGESVVEKEGEIILSINDFSGNPCVRLDVTTSQGVFYADENIFYLPTDNEIGFLIYRSQFVAKSQEQPRYWVFPLVNFVSHFYQFHQDLDKHPLRIEPAQQIVTQMQMSEHDKQPRITKTSKRTLVFTYNKELGFIDPLPDYEDRKGKLVSGKERRLITSVMIGSIDEKYVDNPEIDEWLPEDLLLLLGIATGVAVGAPWVELRDKEARLVKRLHLAVGQSSYPSKVRSFIDERFYRGTGRLLTQASLSSIFNTPRLRTTLKLIIQARQDGVTIENKLSLLFRALDGLCKEYKIGGTQTAKQILPKEEAKMLKKIIGEATKLVEKMVKEAQQKNEEAQALYLKRVAGGVKNATSLSTGFGKMVVALIEKFDFPDAQIIANHYKEHPRLDGKDWPTVLSTYRGIAIHEGFFDFIGGKHVSKDVIIFVNHLQDLLIRIIFKILEYDGEYQPSVGDRLINRPVDWVKLDTPADRLGYK